MSLRCRDLFRLDEDTVIQQSDLRRIFVELLQSDVVDARRRNRQPIAFVASPQSLTKRPKTAHFIVTRDPLVRQPRAAVIEHFQGRFDGDLPRHNDLGNWD